MAHQKSHLGLDLLQVGYLRQTFSSLSLNKINILFAILY